MSFKSWFKSFLQPLWTKHLGEETPCETKHWSQQCLLPGLGFGRGAFPVGILGSHLFSEQSSHWPARLCSCSWCCVSFYFPYQQRWKWIVHGGSTLAGTAGDPHPCGHSNPHNSPREAAGALNNWGTSYFGESKNSYCIRLKKSFSGVWWNRVQAEGEIHPSKYHHGKVGGRWSTRHLAVFLKLCKNKPVVDLLWDGLLLLKNLLTPFTTNGHSSPDLSCISGLSGCFCPPSLLFASLPMPISTLIAKKPCLFSSWLLLSPGCSDIIGFTAGASYGFGNSWITK